jgi:hypothetical protein
MERVKGIEPSLPAWKAGARPLCHTRITKNEKVERAKGIEPSQSPWQGVRLPLHHARMVPANGSAPLSSAYETNVLLLNEAGD